MESEKISIIVPIYNVEKYLKKCVSSLINQTYHNLEIILVDDGTPDNSGTICDEFCLTDERVRVIHKENGGLSDARNAGIECASGTYILFVDSDDFIHPQMVEVLYRNLKEKGADISICCFEEVQEEESTPDFEEITEENIEVFEGMAIMEQLIYKNLVTVVAWNKLYKRDLWNDLRYPRGYIHEDEFVIHELLHMAKKTVYTDAKLYYYLQRVNSITGQVKLKNVQDSLEAYERRMIFLKTNQYEYMLCETRKDFLFLCIKYYNKLKKGKEAKQFRIITRKRFAEVFAEPDVRDSLDRETMKLYTVFEKSPKMYYAYHTTLRYKKKLKDGIKKLIRK